MIGVLDFFGFGLFLFLVRVCRSWTLLDFSVDGALKAPSLNQHLFFVFNFFWCGLVRSSNWIELLYKLI